MPFSCIVGGCGACRVRLVEGSVEMEEPNCLTDAERAEGWVLACVGRPDVGGCRVRVEGENG
jgi:ring-1,2-phenylacetyl-CoA epoxidase subunit PaaE